MDAKVEHLKFIQAAIARMATNSFLLKGWTVTLVAALFAFGAKDADRRYTFIAYVPLVVFACLDAYYLQRERMYRRLYGEAAAKGDGAPVDFNMDTARYKALESYWSALKSKTVAGFYLPLVALMIPLTLYIILAAPPTQTPVTGPKTITISIQ